MARSRADPQCRPNVISYSALMTVYCQAGQLDKAEDAFQHMKLQGVNPDHICYSTLIAGEGSQQQWLYVTLGCTRW